MIQTTPRPGDIGLTSIEGFTGGLVRVLQWVNGDGFSPYTHSFIVLEDGMLIEGQPGGAEISPLTKYDGRHVLYVSPEGLTDEDRMRICAEARKFEGTPYSFVDYAAIAVHRLRLPFPGLKDYVASTKHQICSQLVDNSYRQAGIGLFRDGRWAGYTTPGSLYRRLVG